MFLKLKDGRFVDSESFGEDTWGSSSFQVYIYRARKYWYIRSCWFDGNTSFGEVWDFFSRRLDVVGEFVTLPEGTHCIDFCEY